MAIQLSPETEKLVEQEIASGRFQSVDEIIQQGVRTHSVNAGAKSRRREAIEHLREYIDNPIRLDGITIRELIEEGRRM